jgi:hypothetical protein
MGAWRIYTGIAIALAALVLVPAAGAAEWSEPETVAKVPFRVESMYFGVAGNGGALADWGLRRVFTGARTGGGWRVEPGPALFAPRVLVDDRGRVVHVGFAADRRRNSFPAVATGTLGRTGPVQPLDVHRPRRHFFDLQAAGNRRGDAIVAWSTLRDYTGEECDTCEDVFVRVRRRGGAFGPRRRIASGTTLDDLRVAMSETGEAAVLWTKMIDFSGGEAYARTLGRDGAWTARERIPGNGYTVPSEGATDIALAMGSRGRVLVAFASFAFGEGADNNDYPQSVDYSVRRSGGGFTPLRALSPRSAIGGRQEFSEGEIGHLDAAYLDGDTALVAWTAFDEEDRAHAHAALVRGETVVRKQAFTSGPLQAEVADVVAGPGGTGLVLFYTRGSQFYFWEPRELRSVLARGGAFEPARTVRRGDNEIVFAQAGFDARSGRATAAWIERLLHGRTSVRTASLRTR